MLSIIALYNPVEGFFFLLWVGIPYILPGYYMGLCGLLWAYMQGLYIRGFIL